MIKIFDNLKPDTKFFYLKNKNKNETIYYRFVRIFQKYLIRPIKKYHLNKNTKPEKKIIKFTKNHQKFHKLATDPIIHTKYIRHFILIFFVD